MANGALTWPGEDLERGMINKPIADPNDIDMETRHDDYDYLMEVQQRDREMEDGRL